MNKSTLDKIQGTALYLEELLSSESELLKVWEFTADPSHKRIVKSAIAALARGGIEFQETSTGKFQTTGMPRTARRFQRNRR